MGQGQEMPFWHTVDQSLVSFGWKGATKARIWPLAIFQGLLIDLGINQGKLRGTNWLRLLKYKFPGFSGRAQIHRYSALLWPY